MFGPSEVQPQKPTGRRHKTNEVTSNEGIPSYYTTDAAVERRVQEQHRAQNMDNMSSGPSFLDRMGERERTEEVAQRGSKHRDRDQLNLFHWNDGSDSQPKQAARGNRPPPSDREAPPRGAAKGDAEARRTQEANKFENATGSAFLNFETKTNAEKKDARRASAQGTRNTSFSGNEKTGGFMDGLQRQEAKPQGRRHLSQQAIDEEEARRQQQQQQQQQQQHSGKRHVEQPDTRRAVQGEPQAETPVHLKRKPIASNVFPQGVLGSTEQQYDAREVDGQLVFGRGDDVCPTPASEAAPSQASCDVYHANRRGSRPEWQQRSSLKFGEAGLGSYDN